MCYRFSKPPFVGLEYVKKAQPVRQVSDKWEPAPVVIRPTSSQTKADAGGAAISSDRDPGSHDYGEG